MNPGFVLQALRRWTVAEVVIARKSSRSGDVRGAVPCFVVFTGIAISFLQPGPVLVSRSLLCFVNSQDHRGEEWRLRTRQIIRTVGIQDRSIMFDLEKEVVYHAPRQVNTSGT